MEQLVATASVYLIVCSSAARTHQTRTWSVARFSAPRLATRCLLATWKMREARVSRAANYGVSLCQLMASTMSQHTTDRRDWVYALYGMLEPRVAVDLPVNYNQSTAVLGVRLSAYFLRNKNGVWMLLHCCGMASSQPSWTIDLNGLSARHASDPLCLTTQPDGTNTMYTAGKSTRTAVISLHSVPGCLEIHGLVVDVVEHTPAKFALPVDELFGESEQRITPERILKYIEWFVAILQWAQQFITADAQSDAFWRTLVANFNPHQDDPERGFTGHPKPGFEAYFNLLVTYAKTISGADLDFHSLTEDDFQNYYPVPPGAVKYWIAMIAPLSNRRIIRTRSGRFGLVPDICEIGDVIAVFHGVPVPFVLRKDVSTDRFRVVGISYVHGLMNGKALEQGLHTRKFCLR